MRKVDRIWDCIERGRDDGEEEEVDDDGDDLIGSELFVGGLEDEDVFFWGGFDLGI